MKILHGLKLIGALLMLFLSSCKNQDNTDSGTIELLINGLINSNTILERQNSKIYHDINSYLSNPISKSSLAIWYPKTLKIQNESKELRLYFDSLLIHMQKAEFDEFNQMEIDLLSNNIVRTKRNLLAVDPKLEKEFSKDLDSLFSLNHSSFSLPLEKYFSNGNKLSNEAVLRKLENSILIAENKLIEFCANQIPRYTESFSVFNTLIGINSMIFSKGDTVEINAGVGSFSLESNPHFIFNKNEILVDSNSGIATYKFAAKGKSGKYSIPIIVQYTDEDSMPKMKIYQLEYRIK